MSRPATGRPRPVVARRLILLLLAFSSLITLITTSIQLYVDFGRDVDTVVDEFGRIERSYVAPLVLDLWVLDDEQVATTLDGILQLPNIEYAAITQQGRELYRSGSPGSERRIVREFELRYLQDGTALDLGTLTVQASLNQAWQRMFDRLGIIVLSNALKTFAVVLFVYFIFRGLVTRHLEAISRHLMRVTPGNGMEELVLDRKRRAARDELDTVVDAINRMQHNLHKSYGALRESEARLRAIFDNSPNCIALKDKEDRFVLMSPQFARVLDLPVEAALGRPAQDLMSRLSLSEREASRAPVQHEYDLKSERRVFLANDFPVVKDDGEVIGVGMLWTDVTRLKTVERELAAQRDRLEAAVGERTAELEKQARIIDQIHDAVIAVDMNARVSFWNKGAERLFGHPQSAMLGQSIERILPAQHDGTLFDDLAQLRLKGDHDTETLMRRHSGETFYAHLSLSTLLSADGRPDGVIAYAIDIDERKRTETILQQRTRELETANKELESFSYSVSHDLRAPLRAIDGFSHALLHDYPDQLDETARHYLSRVRAASQHMGRVIDDILKLSRLSRAGMNRVTVDLSEIAESVLEKFREGEPGRTVETSIAPQVTVAGDPGLLRITMENLLGNAWKFTRENAGARIEFGVALKRGKRVYYVRDNGVGFDMRYADKLFGAFQRLHDAQRYEGTGIGLATVARIVERHGGTIWAEAQPGEGATFYFALPAGEGEQRLAQVSS